MNKQLQDLGLRPAPEPLPEGVRVREKFVKIPGESKMERRMRRRKMSKV